MKRYTRIGLYGFAFGFALMTPAMAKGGGGHGGGHGKHEQGGHSKGKGGSKGDHGKGHVKVKEIDEKKIEKKWTDEELDKRLRRSDFEMDRARALAQEYRVAGYEDLPPGIKKGLLRGKPLPPGIERRTLPPEFLSKLPAYDGYEWRGYGQDLILYSPKEQLIADVISGIFR